MPIARGMGSSAACIVAGIRLADAMGGGRLTQQQLELAAELDGHPDNVARRCWAGHCRGSRRPGCATRPSPVPEGLCAVVMIQISRCAPAMRAGCCPETIDRADGVFSLGARGAVRRLAGRGQAREPGRAAMEDRLHQPYRKATRDTTRCWRPRGRQALALRCRARARRC